MRKIAIGALLLLILLNVRPAWADSPIVGEIRLWAGPSGTIPDGWEIADGTELSVSTYASLYSVIGCTYGCNLISGTEFSVPDLSGRVAVGYSTTGADSEFDSLGETGGEKRHTLTITEMPAHTHQMSRQNTAGSAQYTLVLTDLAGTSTTAAAAFTGSAGGSQSHNNLQPYITLYYIIYTGVLSATPTPTPTITATPPPTATPMPGGQTGPITGTITGSLVITQALPSYAFTTTLSTGNEFVWSREMSYGEIIAGSGGVGVSLVLIFYFVAKFTKRSQTND